MRSSRSHAKTTWGDGLVDESWQDMLAVDDWSICGPDDFIRVFPRLLPKQGSVPLCLLQHLTECVAVRAWRLLRRGEAPDALVSMDQRDALTVGRSAHGNWFVQGANMLAALRRPFTRPDTLVRDRADLRLLDGIVHGIQSGTPSTFDETTAARVAFLAGVHPAYLWPEALLFHERYSAAGWLGVLSRGRRALIPQDVADYLVDVLERGEDRVVTLRDPVLAGLASDLDLDPVWRAARGRHGPRRVSVRARWRPTVAPGVLAPTIVRGSQPGR